MSSTESAADVRLRRAAARRTALWVAVIAVAVYVGFMAMAVVKAS